MTSFEAGLDGAAPMDGGSALEALIAALSTDIEPAEPGAARLAAPGAGRPNETPATATATATAFEAALTDDVDAAAPNRMIDGPAPPAKLRAPRIGPPPRDAEGCIDFNAYYDEIGLVFEAAAAPGDALAGTLEPASGGRAVLLDAARARRVAIEAREAGCAPEAILAAALDLYFSVLNRA